MRGARLAAIGGCLALALSVVAGPAVASQPPRRAGAAAPCEPPRGNSAAEIKAQPWPQRMLNFTDAWRLTRGGGVRVAVVDSGVDAAHPQLRGVRMLDVTGTGAERDCLGHGTHVAGIIGGRDLREQGVPFLGVAPAARIISIKAAVQASDNPPQWTADAIKMAADLGAEVINVSSSTPDYPALEAAVKYAQRKDALIVAAAGNVDDPRTDTVVEAYPAGYDGVVSVGGIAPDGSLVGFSNAQTPVTVTAPAKDIISTWPGGDYYPATGTSFAAPYVAGTAALVRAYHPKLNHRQVKHRIERTADGGTARGSGSGLINPLRAVSAVLPEEGGDQAAEPVARRVEIARPEPGDSFGRVLALALAAGALALAAVLVLSAVILPAARRRSATGRS